ncbi:MAG: DUF1566 domain-containing protein [Bacteroidales bacterium]|nr:DUF1566 domain-containing protein [Bacteroidales bacterium]
MKTLKTIIFASAALIATVACTKEANPKESVPSAPGTIEVNVTALIGDLAPSEGTKATMAPVIRLTWENTDKVYAYDATQKIGELTVIPVEGNLSAKLSGDISAPAANTTKITLVYCTGTTPTMTDNKLSFDLSTQAVEANPFVVYATLDYTTGLTSITDKIVPFNFATSLMRVTVTGLANKDITNATVSGVNTKCELTVNADSEPDIAGTTPGTITRAADGITKSDDGRAVFNVSVAAEAENTNRKLTIKQGDLIYGSDLMSGEIAAGTSIISVYALTEQTGSRGKINGHDYVYVAGKKWATQNLAISDSGKGAWLSAKVPGTTTDVVVGDYFQWGVYPNHTTAANGDQGLLTYTSFANMQCGGTEDKFEFKTGNKFDSKNTAPYGGSAYTKYVDADKSYRPNLDISDDVAHTLWGGSWRMPTSDEFKALKDVTYWNWEDVGYYVYAPQSGDAGKKNNETSNTYNKSDALLFFPAAGYGNNGLLSKAGTNGYYWSSTLYSGSTDNAYYLSFRSGNVSPQSNYSRYDGFSVRPLSD